jgi:energy-coupling factor transporter ATP-binding protein EcfA2
MYTYRIDSVTFNDGTVVTPGNLMVLVGPNNAGKTRALRDLSLLTTEEKPNRLVVVTQASWPVPRNIQELTTAYPHIAFIKDGDTFSLRTLMPNLSSQFSYSNSQWPHGYEWLTSGLDRSFGRIPASIVFASVFGKALLAFLTTEDRLRLVRQVSSPGDAYEATLLHSLYHADSALDDVINAHIREAFNLSLALDYTTLQQMLFRASDDFGHIPENPRRARFLMTQFEKLDEQGDGLRSYAGIIVALLAAKRPLVLIDEPEAFLHPPQAYRMGRFLAGQAVAGQQVIVATHSADVLKGILSKTRDACIVRIDRTRNMNAFRVLDATRLCDIATDPLLNSTRVLEGLFYHGVVVVEGEGDARFYQAASLKRRPDVDLHFVNADNKQRVPTICGLYREMGVRYAGIVDFDVLNNDDEFKDQVACLDVTPSEMETCLSIQRDICRAGKETIPEDAIANIRTSATEILEDVAATELATGSMDRVQAAKATEELLSRVCKKSKRLFEAAREWREFKRRGRDALPEGLQVSCDKLLETCKGKGLLINPCGELESLLVQCGIDHTTNKANWISTALRLVAQLTVDNKQYPWKLIKALHEALGLEREGTA